MPVKSHSRQSLLVHRYRLSVKCHLPQSRPIIAYIRLSVKRHSTQSAPITHIDLSVKGHSPQSTPIRHIGVSVERYFPQDILIFLACQSKLSHSHRSHTLICQSCHSPQSALITKSFITEYTHQTSACQSSHSRQNTSVAIKYIVLSVKSHSPQSTPITHRLASQKSFTTKYTHHTSACHSKVIHHKVHPSHLGLPVKSVI